MKVSEYAAELAQRVPQVNGTLMFEQQEEQVLVYIRERPAWAVLNWLSFTLLSLSDGKTSMDRIVDCACLLTGKERLETVSDVMDLFDYLADIELIHFQNSCGSSLSPQAYLPLTVYLNITTRCNLRCSYCYAKAGPDARAELSLEEVRQVLRSLDQISNDVKINISGGEPLLHPDPWTIASECRQAKHKTTLLTNGTLVTREKAAQIQELFNCVLISLDGPDSCIHDALRGSGSFDLAFRGFQNLLEAGCNVLVGTTVTSLNIETIPRMLDWPDMKPQMLSLNLFVPSGRGAENRSLRPSNDEFYQMFEKLAEKDGGFGHVPGLWQLEPTKLQYGGRCRLGRRIVSVAADGNVYPCHALHRPELLAGNILEQPLDEIWKNSQILKGCKGLTVDVYDGCNSCDIKYFCGGGCRADAYGTTGELAGNPSYCSLLRRIVLRHMWSGSPREPVYMETAQHF